MGSTLVPDLQRRGYTVVPLARNGDLGCLEGFDAVFHLAGESIAAGWWTEEKKERILASRCQRTAALARALCQLAHPPRLFACASGIGFYGSRGEELLTEQSCQGKGFLADVCQQWEEAALCCRLKGIRVVRLRFAPILSCRGGMLKGLLLPFRLGLGGTIGSGEQIVSWVSLQDAISALCHILVSESLEGPINIAVPEPVPQRIFARQLAQALHRPCVVRLPAALVRLLWGQKGEELLLSSCRAYPQKLIESGFCFAHRTLEAFFRQQFP